MSLATPISPVNPVQAAAVTPDALARLLAGGVVDARVVTANAQSGLMRLMLAGTALDLQAENVSLPAGSRVALQQLGTDAQGRVFQIVPLAQNATADAGAFSPKLQPYIGRALSVANAAAQSGQLAASEKSIGSPAAPVQPAISPLAQARDMLMPLVRNALARQGGFAPLFANIDAALHMPLQTVPFSVRLALENVAALTLDPALSEDLPASLQKAVAQSGIFQEAHLAQGEPGAAQADMKTQLLNLRQALAAWLAREEAPLQNQMPLLESNRLRPPLRGEMMQPQKPQQAELSADMKPVAIAAQLLAETDAVLDRIRLMQFAGISDRLVVQPADPQSQQRQWLTEIPLQMQNGVGVLPLAIERDGGSGAGYAAPGARTWRMRFTLETNELGPLDVTVSLRGSHVDVRFWAERPSTAAMIDHQRQTLTETLAESDLVVDSVACQAGRRPQAPQAPAKSAGQFLDCKS